MTSAAPTDLPNTIRSDSSRSTSNGTALTGSTGIDAPGGNAPVGSVAELVGCLAEQLVGVVGAVDAGSWSATDAEAVVAASTLGW